MSSLRAKLERLEAFAPVAPSPSADVLGSSSGTDRAAVLEQLRMKIARVIARDPPPPPRPHDPSVGELPFVAEDTPSGRLYVRLLRLQQNHRVGRFPVHTARRADANLLSLLALDPALSDVDPARALYLDTETTGLSGGTGTLPFLIGLGFFSSHGGFAVEQLLLRRPGEENPILARVAERMRHASMIVSFNGKSFDIPLVRTRFVMNRMSPMPVLRHLDLLHVGRRVHRARIGRCTLGAIESQVLGFGRIDDVPSGEVSARYAHFLRTGDEGALLGVVEHNVWDVVSMAALVGLYGEPTDGMGGEDLAGIATTLQRARSYERASTFADEAVARGGGVAALRARGALAKARGDRDRALIDFEALLEEIDDPAVRLELAKLYEHHRKAPHQALYVLEKGLAEPDTAIARRRARLERKIAKKQAPKKRRKKKGKAQAVLPGVPPNCQE